MMDAMMSPAVEYQLIGNVLDGLDDLYDRRERAAWWLERLLLATSVAFTGTMWERRMSEAADGLNQVRKGEGEADDKSRLALAATDDLRLQVSERWSELEGDRRS
jgi:hypothetical protein